MSDLIELPQKTLTYQAKVDPRPGTLMGPGLDGRVWRVTGAVWDEAESQTLVYVERVR